MSTQTPQIVYAAICFDGYWSAVGVYISLADAQEACRQHAVQRNLRLDSWDAWPKEQPRRWESQGECLDDYTILPTELHTDV